MISSNVLIMEKDAILDALPVLAGSASQTSIDTKLVNNPARAPEAGKVGLPEQREAGDQVNGFLLCTLVSESAKRIKTRARRTGISLPMTIITRFVLRAYRLAATDHFGPFSTAALDVPVLHGLDAKILNDVLAYLSVEKVKNDLAKRAKASAHEAVSRR
jgi:hypothetical protein